MEIRPHPNPNLRCTMLFKVHQERDSCLYISIIDEEGIERAFTLTGEHMPTIMTTCHEVYTNYINKLDEAGLLTKEERKENKELLRKKTKTQKPKSQKTNDTPSLF